MSTPPRDFAEWMKLMERKVMLANRSGQAVLARQLTAEIIKVRDDLAGAADTRTPAAPIEFTIQSSVRTDANGKPYSEAAIDFSDVTVATDASAITVDRYELWGRDETGWNGSGDGPTWMRLATSTASSFLEGPFVPGTTWGFKVRAIGSGMLVPGQFSANQTLVMVADTTAPSIPPNPDLYQELGVVGVRWNGLASGGGAMPADFRHVELAYGTASGPTDLWPEVFLGAGTIFVTNLPYGTPYYFRMRAVDWSGNTSAWTSSVSITRQPLVSGDISGLDTTIEEQTGRAESAEAAALQAVADAQAAQALADAAQANADAAQAAATAAANDASVSADEANTAQAQADAAAADALAAQQAATNAQIAADTAANNAGASSAAALLSQQAAQAAQTAADAAQAVVNSYTLGGDTMIVNGNFDAPITSPPLGWPTRTLTYNEASSTTARSGSQVLRATPTTSTIAYAYTDYIAAYTGQILYIEYYVRLREALKAGNSAQQLGAYVSALNVAGSSTVYSAFQNNTAPAVTLASLSTTTWTKVAVTQTLSPADIKQVRVGPRIPAVTTAGQNFEIDDFRVVDITQAKAALDAAAAAQTTANTANSAAGSAQGTANSALNAATHNAKNLFSTNVASGTAPLGTLWFQTDGTGKVIGQWQQTAGDASTDGSTWVSRPLTSAVLDNVDVGKLTGGFIDAVHIETENLRVGGGATTLGSKLTTLDTTATTVTGWDDGTGKIPTTKLSGTVSNAQVASGIDPTKLTGTGTVPTGAVPNLPATKITSGTFSGVTVPTGLLSGTVSNAQVASGIDPSKLTGTGTVPTAAVPALDAAKIITGTLPGTVAVPAGNLSGTVSNTQIATGIDPSKLTGSGTVPVAAVPALATSKITGLDTSLTNNANAATAAQATANIAQAAVAYIPNPSFDLWAGTWPDGYTAFSTVVPTKETSLVKIGTQSAKFVTDAVTSAGINIGSVMTAAAFPDLTYYTVEVGFMLTSGTLGGASVVLDWNGYTTYRAGIRLDQAVPSPVLNKWYKVTSTIARPVTGGGAFTGMGGYLMASDTALGAARAAKTIIFDWLDVRPSTDEEIKAYLAKQKVDAWASPSDVTYIDGGKIYTDSIKSLQIDTNDLVADTGFVGSMRTVVLTADSINATMVAAGAITSKHTITGATFQTTATAARGVKFDSSGINAWDSTGVSTFQVDASTGYARIAGRYYSGAPGTGGVGIIPAVDSYNLKQVAILFSSNGSYGSTNAGMWVDDTAGTQVLSLRGHNGGDVEIKSQNLQMNVANGRVGNFSNWALGDSTNGNNYLPNLSINPPSGTGWFRITNAPTVASAANVVIATTPAGVLYKSTSSLRYKADVQDWTPELKGLQLNPRTWVARNPIDPADPFARYYGLIAEEVYAVLPELVTLNEFDEPDGLQYDRIAIALIPILKNVVQRLEALEGA